MHDEQVYLQNQNMSSTKKSAYQDKVRTPQKNAKANFNSYHSAYITNLPLDITETQLKQKFQKYGSIKKINILKLTTHSYCFINFSTSEEVTNIINQCNQMIYKGKIIKVSQGVKNAKNNKENYKQQQDKINSMKYDNFGHKANNLWSKINTKQQKVFIKKQNDDLNTTRQLQSNATDNKCLINKKWTNDDLPEFNLVIKTLHGKQAQNKKANFIINLIVQ